VAPLSHPSSASAHDDDIKHENRENHDSG